MSLRSYFDIPEYKKGADISVRCPLHEDSANSASINFEKGVFNCFAGCGGMTLDQLESKLGESNDTRRDQRGNTEDTGGILERHTEYSPEDTIKRAEALLETRACEGFSDVVLDDNPGSTSYGFLFFRGLGEDFAIGRNLYDTEPKYFKRGKGKLFFASTYDASSNSVWLVEGIFDLGALVSCGIPNVAALLTSDASEEKLFLLRGKTVFILLDCDYAGYSGARKVAARLLEIGANPIIIDLPEHLGKDPAEAWENDKEAFKSFVESNLAELDSNDIHYTSTFSNAPRESCFISSGIDSLDIYLGDGFGVGEHVIGAEPGVGKTSFAVHMAVQAAEAGNKVLINSTEINKHQYWSRVASTKSKHSWAAIRKRPSLLEPEVKEWLGEISKNIKVVVGWTLEKLLYVAPEYNLVIVDYLQDLQVGGFTDERLKISHSVKELAASAAKNENVVIVISSLNRSGYESHNLSIFSETSKIEYAADTAIKMETNAFENGITFDVLKSRSTGFKGKVDVKVDLAHSRFGVEDYGQDYLQRIEDAES